MDFGHVVNHRYGLGHSCQGASTIEVMHERSQIAKGRQVAHVLHDTPSVSEASLTESKADKYVGCIGIAR